MDLRTGAVVAVEALVRWQHPERGLVLPAAFIPLAEESGLIVPIGRWVLHTACRQAREWHDAPPGGRSLVVSVNLTARELHEPGLVAQVGQVLRETGVDPARLRLEITESAAMQNVDAVIATLTAVRGLGVGLALDDFGTGYSSLSHLHRLPVDTLKVDQSFVGRVDTDKGAQAIVRAVTALARALGMTVTAEGVETAAQRERVRALRCDRAQGYYFAPPLPAAAVAELLPRADAPVLPVHRSMRLGS